MGIFEFLGKYVCVKYAIFGQVEHAIFTYISKSSRALNGHRNSIHTFMLIGIICVCNFVV